MPAFSWRLSDQEVADVVSFIRGSWGNQGAPVKASDVADLCKNDRNTVLPVISAARYSCRRSVLALVEIGASILYIKTVSRRFHAFTALPPRGRGTATIQRPLCTHRPWPRTTVGTRKCRRPKAPKCVSKRPRPSPATTRRTCRLIGRSTRIVVVNMLHLLLCAAQPCLLGHVARAGLFETRLIAKSNAADVLEQQLSKPGYVCAPINLGSNTEQHNEK